MEDGGGVAPPADDDAAIAEVERLRSEDGARLLAVAWVSFWWREHYGGLFAHLDATYAKVADDELLLAYDLTSDA